MRLQYADVICLQEVKAQAADLSSEMLTPFGYHGVFHYAEKRGYSGVGIYSRVEPQKTVVGLGWPDMDAEGRYIQVDFGQLSVISVYLPSGSSSPERQLVKFAFLERFLPHLIELERCGRDVVICGDWNIAHTERDLKNWRGNQKNSGFLPEERAWLTRVFNEVGLVDVFRVVNQECDQYTWWSNRGQAWAKNVGWRIDYQVATRALAERAERCSIYKTTRFSDHAPLIIDYDYQV